jgi:hypothetical protein
MVKRETVKINEDLLKRVISITKNKNKKIKYSTAKQFINIAVLELLEKEETSDSILLNNKKYKNEIAREK